MQRRLCTPRPGFQDLILGQGMVYHTNDDGSAYWTEDACYVFTAREVDRLYAAAKELHQMFLAAAAHAIETPDGLAGLDIPTPLHDVIRRSWEADEWEFYGRFDLTLDASGQPRLIEYNADTPTGLLEASIIQWYWKEALYPKADQFNSLHESLVARWSELIAHGQITKNLLHVTSVADHPEDRMTTGYIARTAEEAGLSIEHLTVDRIGWDSREGVFVDEQNRAIRQLFKLYPWEWMGQETFAPQLGLAKWVVLEPAWKAVLASKKLLLVLQELYPGHSCLPRVSDRPLFGSYAMKPVFGREGANVTIVEHGRTVDERPGLHEDENVIYQELVPLLRATPGFHAQCGVWMAGPEPVGMGIREDTRPILGNTSHFVPHIIA